MLIQRLRESGYSVQPEPPRPSFFLRVWGHLVDLWNDRGMLNRI
jgi:hypothetical protein